MPTGFVEAPIISRVPRSVKELPSDQLRVCRIVTVPLTFVTLLRHQISRIVADSIDLTLVSSPGPELDEICLSEAVRCHPLPMARRPHPGRDAIALLRLTRFFRSQRFDIVHSSTPKAGLLTALAGALASVPVRIHTYTGQVWVELQGSMRWFARESDRLIGQLDTQLYADSASQRDFLVSEGIVSPSKIAVLGAGSISGVDLRRFTPTDRVTWRTDVRRQLGIADSSPVVVFVGRVTGDKGIRELLHAFNLLRESFQDLHLLLVGPLEPERAPLPLEVLRELTGNARIHAVGFQSEPERYLAAGDVFCLPSYREGFGTVAIEAAAMELPAVVTRIAGLTDAVAEGETGLLVPPKDPAPLAQALAALLESPQLRNRLGSAARERAIRLFDEAIVNQVVVDEYHRLLGQT